MPTYQITAPDGRTFDVTGPNKEGALAALKAQLAKETQSAQTEAPDTSVMGALRYGGNQAQSLAGKGIQSFGELIDNQKLQDVGQAMDEKNQREAEAVGYQRPENADGIIKNLKEGDIGGAGKSLLYSTAEAAPQVAVGAGTSLAAAGAMAGAPIVGGTLAAGGTLLGINQAMGANRAEKEEKGLDPTATITDLSTAIASGLIELTPLKGGGATLRVLREGAQEMGQEGLVIGGTAVQGGEYVPEEIVTRVAEAGIVGATISKGINTAITTVDKAGKTVFRPKEELDAETGQAAGDVARMMDEIATSEGFNRKNVDPSSQQGANAILNAARSRVRAEIDQNMSILNKEILKNADAETKAKFKETLRQARNKVSNTVTKENLEFVKQKVGGTYEGRSLLNALRKSNVITEVYSSGLKGGVSQFTDNFNPLPRFGRSYTPAGLLTGNINMGAAAATGGQTLAIQIPAVLGGRAIDAVTGRRSKVNTFIRKNRKKAGLDDPTGPKVEGRTAALAAAKQQQAAAKKQADKEANAAAFVAQYNQGLPPNPASPRGKVFEGITEVNPEIQQNMTPREIDQMIDEILGRQEARFAAMGNTRDAQVMLRAITEYRQMLQTGKMGKQEGPLNSVIGMVKEMIQRPPQQTPPQGGSPLPPGQDGPVAPRPARVQDGIDGNRAFLDNLGTRIDEAKASVADKAILKQAVGDMRLNLGSDPVKKLKSIISDARGNLANKNLAEQYLKPYLDRIEMQQAARKAKASRAKPKAKQDAPETGKTEGVPPDDIPSSGSGPILTTPEAETPPVKKPTKAKTKKNLPEAKALIEIGKVGTKYENGIQDVDTALEVAKLLGITAEMLNSGTALQKRVRTSKRTVMARHTWLESMKGFGSNIFFIKPQGSFQGNKIRHLDSLHLALHEMGHALTQGNLDGKGEFGYAEVRNPMSKKRRDQVGANSYNFSVMKPIVEAKGKDPKDNPLIAEILAFQAGVSKGFTQNNPSETVFAREDVYLYLKRINEAEKQGNQMAANSLKSVLKSHQGYTQNTPELSVDPMWLYLMNPKLAKEIMPLNAKAIREEFRKAGNDKIQFYSHPFATILAAVMGMGMLAALGLEEPDEEVMPDGILTA